MRRILGALLLAAALGAGAVSHGAEPPEPRFADVTLRLFTTGERQPIKEVGTFTSSLPLGKAGGLHRTLTITNESRGVSLVLLLGVSVTPSLAEDKVLHCVVLSTATPEGSEPLRRAKDMAFNHPGEQLMELFADGTTGVRLALAVSASLSAQRAADAPSTFPPVNFLVRVEQWSGAQRVEIENVQLQSLEGAQVTHEYRRKVPRWVEGETDAKDAVSLDDLPVLDLNSGTPTVKAGQNFSIALTPAEQGKQKKEMEKAAAKDGSAVAGGGSKKPVEKPRRIVWDEEFYHLSITPVSVRPNELTINLVMRGQILDPATKLLAAPMDLSAEKTLQPGQAIPFYLTRDAAGGTQGFVAWVTPQWSVVPPPEPLPPGVWGGTPPEPSGSTP